MISSLTYITLLYECMIKIIFLGLATFLLTMYLIGLFMHYGWILEGVYRFILLLGLVLYTIITAPIEALIFIFKKIFSLFSKTRKPSYIVGNDLLQGQ